MKKLEVTLFASAARDDFFRRQFRKSFFSLPGTQDGVMIQPFESIYARRVNKI